MNCVTQCCDCCASAFSIVTLLTDGVRDLENGLSLLLLHGSNAINLGTHYEIAHLIKALKVCDCEGSPNHSLLDRTAETRTILLKGCRQTFLLLSTHWQCFICKTIPLFFFFCVCMCVCVLGGGAVFN